MSQEEANNCLTVSLNKAICTHSSPIINNVHDNCELSLLKDFHAKSFPENCKIKVIPNKNYVIRLPKENSYYLHVIEPINFRSICQKTVKNVAVTENGILSIKPNCMLTNKDFTIKAHSSNSLIVNQLISLNVDIKNMVIPDLAVTNKPDRSKPILIEDCKREFDDLVDEINVQK